MNRRGDEAINDRGKLIYHRLIARELRRRPSLREEARARVRLWLEAEEASAFATDWRALLRLDIGDLAREITARTPQMAQLRTTSPFARLPSLTIHDTDLRRRVWRLAKKGIDRGHSGSLTTSIAR